MPEHIKAQYVKTPIDGTVVTRAIDGYPQRVVRTPFVDVPRAALTGDPNAGGTFCVLFGNTVPYDATTLAERHPSRDDFLAEFRKAAKRAVKAGFLLPEESEKLVVASEQIPYDLPSGG